MKFTLWGSSVRQNPQNVFFGNQLTIDSAEKFAAAVQHDVVIAKYIDNHRKTENFLIADCVMLDFDNDSKSNPRFWDGKANWITPEKISSRLPGVSFAVYYSRNHMKEKEGREPRPKFHAVFETGEINVKSCESIMKKLKTIFPELDEDALKPAQQYFGVEQPKIEWFDNALSLGEYLKQHPEIREYEKPKTDPATVSISQGSRSTDNNIILDALDHIDPASLDYRDWLEVGMALKSEGYDVSVWDAWSATDSRYKSSGNESCIYKWSTFGGNTVTGNKIKSLARQRGWTPPQSYDYPVKATKPTGPNVSKMNEPEREKYKAEYLKNSAGAHIQEFVDGIADSVNTKAMTTGFRLLDQALDGGLYEGLYSLGAVSSLGKSTFIMQIVDQTAQAGNDVLVFALEMARSQLMARSISRHTIQEVLQSGGDTTNAKTSRGITRGDRYDGYNKTERQLINSAIETYSTYADRVFIFEGIGDIGVYQIRQTIANHIELTGKRPLVVVDYLQILEPIRENGTDKQNTDKAVLELKRISRDFKIPIIAINSFNRENYNKPVSMAHFKESGAIEYSSDVLLGMQLAGVGEPDYDEDEAKERSPREIEVVILKNREGATGKMIEYKYYSIFNYFQEGNEIKKKKKTKKVKK